MLSKWRIGLLLFVVVTLISGCFGEKPIVEKLGIDAEGELKVFTGFTEEAFHASYGQTFNMKYPNVKLKVINDHGINETQGSERYKLELEKLFAKEKPDLMVVDESHFAEWAQNGKLYNLDGLITQDGFDLTGYMDGYMDRIKRLGNGNILGLSPSISPKVMFYNADLFKEHGIELPRNKMTWQEVIDLGSRFANVGTGKDKVYGIQGEFPEAFLQSITSTSALTLLDAKKEKVLINSDGWKQAIKLATDAVRDETAYVGNVNEPENVQGEKFMQGKIAMQIHYPGFITDLKAIKSDSLRKKYGLSDFEWGMVTVPIDPASPNESTNISMDKVFTIPKDSANLSIAWEFVKLLNSPEKAKSDSKSIGYSSIPARNQFFKEIEGKSTEAFYLLQPKADKRMDDDSEFRNSFDKLLHEALKEIIDNKKTVDEAVAELQQKGQALLIKMREEEKAKQTAA